ncbi:MAG: hypothetical protein ACRCWI_05870 [Brevinema sp.]
MTDLKLVDGEIVLGYEDLELVSRSECLLQDVRNLLMTDFGALFYDKTYGSGVLRYIQTDKSRLKQLKQQIMITLKKDSRINSNSIRITEAVLRPRMGTSKDSFDIYLNRMDLRSVWSLLRLIMKN